MLKSLPQLQIVHRSDLRGVNEKIAALAAVKPCHAVYTVFSLAAHFATQAITAAQELQASGHDLQPTLEFWYRARDYNYAAAFAVAGGNQSLAEALVTLRLLENAAVEIPDVGR
jgi:hypothetical protein